MQNKNINIFNVGRIVFNEGLISLLFHCLKSIIALYINWLILNELNSDDYVIWSVTSSILMIATASDLGVGQHTVTMLINSVKEMRGTVIGIACIALSPLFLISFVFVLSSLSGPVNYVIAMALFVSLRLFSIPFGALLNATNKFKVRKIVEFFTYLIAAVLISFIVFVKKDVQMSLLALNISFMLGATATVYLAIKEVPGHRVKLRTIRFKEVFSVFNGSLPFLINNITALLTYGGFIWISSFVLTDSIIAKVSVLHNFFLMTLYQLYDVFLRSKQADLVFTEKILFFLKLNKIIVLLTPLLIIAFGSLVLKIVAPGLSFGLIEIFLFSLFIVIEFCYLIIQSIIQVDFKYAKGLFLYSFIKSFSIAIPFIIFFLLSTDISLVLFLSMLNIFSLAGLVYSNYFFKLKTGFSL